jgi:hypothetical protein
VPRGPTRRPVFEQLDSFQYVLDDDGERLHGVWYIPPDCGVDLPVIVPGAMKTVAGALLIPNDRLPG